MGNCLSQGNKSAKAPQKAPEPGGPSITKPSKQIYTVLGKQTEDVTSLYTLGRVLGKGQFGTTRLAEEKSTGDKYACKSISKRKLTSAEDIEDVRREVQIMHHLAGHPNITRLRGAYEDKHSVHLVMELCAGGELFDQIVKRTYYSEKDAAAACRTIVSIVAHCNNLGVIHRDLKPENFLLATKEEDSPIKATDFGLSVFFKPDQVFTDIVGSAYYVAPEVLRRHYSYPADLWSCGVILYIMLSGVPPFWGDTEQQIFDAILVGKIDFQSAPWPQISQGAKDCVSRMLQQDPKKRASADEILQHEWMKENGTASAKPLDNVILQRMKGFANMNKLKKEALKVIASGMSPEEIAGLRSLFQAMDADKSGTITVEELREGLKKQGTTTAQSEVESLLSKIDVDANGTLDYEEFIAATVNLSQLEKEENLYRAFSHFDLDNSGYITLDELETALKGGQGGIGDMDIQQILKEVDKDNDGRIDYQEFCDMMRRAESPKADSPKKEAARRGRF